MTKPKTDFSVEDMAIARRALWLLEGHGPEREQLSTAVDLGRLMRFNGSDGFALPLAHFAAIRYMDATRAAPLATTPAEDDHPANPGLAEAEQRLAIQHEAACLEKRAREHLSEALLRSSNAFEAWQAATAKRADGWAGMPALSPILSAKHEKILTALLAAQDRTREGLVLIDVLMRELPPAGFIDEFLSTFGLPLAQRNEVLGDQVLTLSEAGISVEHIGYVMGWNYGTPEQSKDRTRKRLDEARARRTLPAV